MRGIVLGAVVAVLIVGGHPVSATVPGAPCDSVTGGGFIIGSGADRSSGLAAGAKATFGVGGGAKNGAFWGHLEYNDHSTTPPLQVHGTSVTNYTTFGSNLNSRMIQGIAEVNGVGGFIYTVEVTDNADPGGGIDEFSIELSTGYMAGTEHGDGRLAGGNIQLHKPNPSTTTCP